MIDISAWRAAIGSWYFVHSVKHSCSHNYQGSILEYSLVLVCILSLLLIGGIESNPGPVLRSHGQREVNSGKVFCYNHL